MARYVHGYTEREGTRLNDQATALDNILHHDSIWEKGSLVLEAGCGIGAQTKIIASKNPSCQFVSVDISPDSVEQARRLISSLALKNVRFSEADIFDLPFEENYFDHVFLCFVLEHLPHPEVALTKLKKVLKPGGTITLIEGDHGSTYFHPDSKEAQLAVQCLVDLQAQSGGDANIGRRLFPLLKQAGFSNIRVSPRQVYVDDSNPELVAGFTRNTFAAMIEGVADEAVNNGLITGEEMKKGINDLYRTAEGDGTFCYTFFKGTGRKE